MLNHHYRIYNFLEVASHIFHWAKFIPIYSSIKPAIDVLNCGQFSSDQLKLNTSMGSLIVPKSIHESISVQPTCWIYIQLLPAAIVVS